MSVTNEHVALFLSGKHDQAYEFLGSFLNKDSFGHIISTTFTVYAPHAKEVRLISSDNDYEGWKHVLTKIDPQGIWSITIPKNLEWVTYKYEIHLENGSILYKSDPFAHFFEERPANASKVYDIDGYQWQDQKWFDEKKKVYQEPMLIYEVHLGSWMRTYGAFKKYHEVVDTLLQYVKKMGFTHIELMPIYEHPLDDSWGYQGTGFFAATSRYGTPKELMYLIDRAHQEGIGIIVDWVLGHINQDEHGLFKFDGTHLYEFEDKERRENVTWGTSNLDFGKGITRSFMLSALNFWVDYFHVDGFRIDAVSHLIYHLGDMNKGENHAAVNFLKQVSKHLFSKDDRMIFSAEDSTAYPGVTWPVEDNGLGFNYKWNMGWMNDVLSFFKKDPIHRKYHMNQITFGLMYAYNEQFLLPLSHDEVVHMKGSLWNKMPGSDEEKFMGWRLLMVFFMTYPGKKLLFMGQEFAQVSEWDFSKELDWYVLDNPDHKGAQRYFKALAHLYQNEGALYRYDHDPKGFKWLISDHQDSCVFVYMRKSDSEYLIVILNMTPMPYDRYEIGVPFKGSYMALMNTNLAIYGGTEKGSQKVFNTFDEARNNEPFHIKVKIGPLSGLILKYNEEETSDVSIIESEGENAY